MANTGLLPPLSPAGNTPLETAHAAVATPRLRPTTAATSPYADLISDEPPKPAGLVEPGNIDLLTRPIHHNTDGTISTVKSASFEVDGKEVLVPTIADDGTPLSDREAFDLYRKTGKHLGIFDSADNATAYAKKLHEDQAALVEARGDFSDLVTDKPNEADTGDRLRSAAGSLVQGATQSLTALPKEAAIIEGQRRTRLLQNFDQIDKTGELPAGEATRSQLASKRIPLNPTVEYWRATPDQRQRLRDSLGNPDPRKMQFYQAGEALDAAVQKIVPTDPRVQGEFLSDTLPQGVGSTFGFLATGLFGKVLKIPALLSVMGSGAAAEASSQFDDALQHGASLDDAFKTANMAAVVGTSEALPISNLLSRLDKGTGGSVKRALTEALIQGTEEAVQEAAQTIAENLIANNLVGYDPERGTFTAADQGAAVGFTAGGLMGFLMSLVGGKHAHAGGKSTATPPPPGMTPEQVAGLKAYNLTDGDIAKFTPQEAAGFLANAKTTEEQFDLLNAAGYSDDEIAAMSTSEIEAEVKKAKADGVKVASRPVPAVAAAPGEAAPGGVGAASPAPVETPVPGNDGNSGNAAVAADATAAPAAGAPAAKPIESTIVLPKEEPKAPVAAAAGPTPEFKDVLAALPKDDNGDPNADFLKATVREVAGKDVAWNVLTDDQRRAVFEQVQKPVAASAHAQGVADLVTDEAPAVLTAKPAPVVAEAAAATEAAKPEHDTLLAKILSRDMDARELNQATDGKKNAISLQDIAHAVAKETAYDRLSRLSVLLRHVGESDRAPSPSGKGKKAKAEHEAAAKAQASRASVRDTIAKQIDAKRAKIMVDALAAAGIKAGDTVRYNEPTFDGRTGETRTEPVVGPVGYVKGQPTATVYADGGILFLNPDDLAKRVTKMSEEDMKAHAKDVEKRKKEAKAKEEKAGRTIKHRDGREIEVELKDRGPWDFETTFPKPIAGSDAAADDSEGGERSPAQVVHLIDEMVTGIANDRLTILKVEALAKPTKAQQKAASDARKDIGDTTAALEQSFDEAAVDAMRAEGKRRAEERMAADVKAEAEKKPTEPAPAAKDYATQTAEKNAEWSDFAALAYDAKMDAFLAAIKAGKVRPGFVPKAIEYALDFKHLSVANAIKALKVAEIERPAQSEVDRILRTEGRADAVQGGTKALRLSENVDEDMRPWVKIDALARKLLAYKAGFLIVTPNGLDVVGKPSAAPAGEAKPSKTAAEKPAPGPVKPKAEPSTWTEIGKNSVGKTLFEDQRGVRSYVENGVRVTEPVRITPGGSIILPPKQRDRSEWNLAEDQSAAANEDWWDHQLTPYGRRQAFEPTSINLPDTVKWQHIAPDKQAKLAALRGTAQDPLLRGKPAEEHPGLVIKSLQTGKETTIQPAGTVPPLTWADAVKAVPKDSTGMPDTDMAFRAIAEVTGSKTLTFNELNAEQKAAVMARIAERAKATPVKPTVSEAAPGRAPAYGASNKLVTADRADELRARLRAKLKNQVSAGIDPEMLSIGAELTVFHIEAGARKFADLVKAIAADLGVDVAAIRPYLKGWYNGARDLMEDGGVDIAGMDSAETVREVLKALDEGAANGPAKLEEPSPPALAGKPAPAVQGAEGGRKAGGRAGLRGAANASGNVAAGSERPVDAGSVGENAAGVPVPAREPVVSAATPADRRAPNYTLTDADKLGEGSAKTKFSQNVAAIKLAKELERSGASATPAEQAVLAKYVGWGGLKQVFPREDKTYPQGWEDAGKTLAELLTPEEYAAARASTQNAHYTSPTVVKAMWSAVRRLGFHGGRVLEPSVGTGNFLGFMPDEVRERTQISAVELDHLTGQIVKNLYPRANIQAPVGFEDFVAPDGWFDLAIGNPPFGAVRVYDPRHKKISRFSIHNFFFAKSIDMLRDDGVLAMVVTNFMMDASRDGARQYIAGKTELLGAIRLPNDAFAKNAGTEVTTDILFLRKLKAGEKAKGESWLDSKVVKDKEGRELLLNEYYVRHPEQMLGDFGLYGTMYGPDPTAALVAREGQDTAALLNAAIARLPQNVMPPAGELVKPPVEEVPTSAATATVGSMFADPKGGVWIRKDDLAGEIQAERVNFENAKAAARVAGMVKVRDAFTTVRAAQMSDTATDASLAKVRKALNVAYDDFVAVHGPVNADANKRLFRDDPTWPQVSALEESFDKGISEAVAKKTGEKAREPSAKKAAVFTRRTQSPYHAPTSAASAKDALAAVLVEYGRVDMDRMAELYGRGEEDIVRELGPLLFKNPAGGYETRDHYLSGNVKQKLAIAERAAAKDSRYAGNVEELKAVIPKDIAAVDISVKAGAHWLPERHVSAFADHIYGGNRAVKAIYVKATAAWTLHGGYGPNDSVATKWGTQRTNVHDVLAAALNGKTITVHDKWDDGSTTINQPATDAANEKIEAVKAEFQRWIWADDARRTELHRLYNDSFNTDVQRKFDGSHLTFAGKVSDDVIRLRPHQADAVWRIVQSGTTLLDHVVGSGKTFTKIAAIMELRRMGLARKPMLTVPNHLVGQWAADFIRLYPGAKILAATKKDFEAENRKRLFARVATGDYDAVIVAHSSFGKIAVDPRFQQAFIEGQIRDIEASVDAYKAATGEKKSRTVAQLEKARDNLEAKLKRLLDSGSKDQNLTFEEMGIDGLFVDEAHEFKNLGYSTSMQRVAGLGKQEGSQKAADLFVKVQSILERTNGRNVVFATGTPISNTMAEMFTIQRYLDGRALRDMGLSHFDAWARMFGEVVTDWELSPAGKYKLNSRFAKFVNMPELMQRYRSFGDVITNDDIKRQLAAQGRTLPLPKVKGGKPQNLVVDRSAQQASYIGVAVVDANGNEQYPKGTLIWRSENLPKGPPKKGDDNMLKIMSDARKAALDMRLIDPKMPDVPGSKVHQSADNILRLYRKWDKQKGTQLVFIDLSTPKNAAKREADAIRELMAQAEAGDEAAQEKLDAMSPDEFLALDSEFSVYDDLRGKLMQRGIPAHEIAFIHDANTELQKEELFGRVRSGRVRVLLGSTPKLGAGTNVQNRLVGLHHLDAPWRPSDLEQREGRIIRQGNELYVADPDGFEVEILRYATKNTLDTRMWQTIEGKARFIEQYRKGDINDREIEDVAGEASNAAEMKAAASGNPLILEEMDLRQQLRKLDTSRLNHDREQYDIRDRIRWNEKLVDVNTAAMPAARADAEKAAALPKDFSATIAGETFGKMKEAGEAAIVAAGAFKDGGADNGVLGSYGQFQLRLAKGSDGGIYVQVPLASGPANVRVPEDADPVGLMMRLRNTLTDLVETPRRLEAALASAQREVGELSKQIREWPDAAKLAAVKTRHQAIINELRPKPKAPDSGPPKNPDGTDKKLKLGNTLAREGASPAPTFYSAVARAIDGSTQAKASAGQWLATIKNTPGVKAEELEWLGLEDWLKSQTGSITKTAIADFVRANQLQVKETTLADHSEGGAGGLQSIAQLRQRFPTAFDMLESLDVEPVTSPDGAELMFRYQGDDLNYQELRDAAHRDWYEPTDDSETGGKLLSEVADHGTLDPGVDASPLTAAELLSAAFVAAPEGAARFSSYQLPGGKDYHELLLALPAKPLTGNEGPKGWAVTNNSNARVGDPNFVGGHFDTPNVVVHVRFNTRTAMQPGFVVQNARSGFKSQPFASRAEAEAYQASLPATLTTTIVPDGIPKHTLFIEEIQSDWHKQGRKRGYAQKPLVPADLTLLRVEPAPSHFDPPSPSKYWFKLPDGYTTANHATDTVGFGMTEGEARANATQHLNVWVAASAGVPDAPFKTTWPELAFKRMVRWAAENGYDQIAWTPGIEQLKRYEAPLREQVKSIEWEAGALIFRIVKIASRQTVSGQHLFEVDANGVIESAGVRHTRGAEDVVGETLESLVGKEIATRIMGEESGTIEGDNLHIGGKGYTDLYDKQLVQIAGKIGKKFGAKVGETQIATVDQAAFDRAMTDGDSRAIGAAHVNITAPSLPITDAMRQSVTQEGQSLFDRSGGTKPIAFKPGEREKAERAVAAIIKRVAGRDVAIRLSDTIDARGAGDAAYQEDMAAYSAAGGRLNDTAGGVMSAYPSGKAVIDIAMADRKYDPIATAFHESYHRAEAHLMSRAEFAAVNTDEAVNQARAAAAKVLGLDLNDPSISSMPGYEARAIAFEGYALRAMQLDALGKIPAALRRFFVQLRQIAEQVRAFIMRQPYGGALKDAYEAAYTGQFGERSPQVFREITSYGSTATREDAEASAVASSINRVMRSRADSLLETVRAKTDPIRVKVQDRVLPIRRQQEAMERQTGQQTPVHLDTYIAEALYHGRAAARLVDLRRQFLEPLVARMKAAGISTKDFGDYLYARHAPERNAAIREIDPDNDAGSGMTDAAAAAIVRRAETGTRADSYASLATMVDELVTATRDTMVADGLLSRDTADEWAEKYPHYVPLRGWEADPETDAPRTGRGFDVRGPESRTALGRRTKADNPLAYLIMQAESAIVRGEKNTVGKTFLRFVRANPDPETYRVIKSEIRRRISPTTGLVEEYAVPPAFSRNENLFSVKVGGKTTWIEVHDPKLARALRGAPLGDGAAAIRAVLGLTRLYASLLTSYNPEFVVSNALRDIQTAMVNIGDTEGGVARAAAGRMLKDFLTLKAVRGIVSAMRDPNATGEYARYFEEYRHAGGMISFMDFNDLDRIKKQIDHLASAGRIREAVTDFVRMIESANTTVENGVRLSSYIALRKAGVSEAKAAFVARELTVNFNRKGELGPLINAAYMFFNASIQGATRIVQGLARSKNVRRAVLSMIVLGAVMDLLNGMVSGDDDDGETYYDNLPAYIKERNLILMWPGGAKGEHFMVPMPYGYNAAVLAGQQIMSVLRGKTSATNAAGTVVAAAANAFSPLGMAPTLGQFIAPTLLDPFVQVAENKTFTGASIQPTSFNKNKPQAELYWPNTPQWAILAAKEMNEWTGGNVGKSGFVDISPETLEHFATFLGGGAGAFALNVGKTAEELLTGKEWLPEDAPFVRRVYGQAGQPTKRREFYDLRDKTSAAQYEVTQLQQVGDQAGAEAARKRNAEMLRIRPMVEGAQKQIDAITKQRAALDRSQLTDAQKKVENDRLDALEAEAMKRALQAVRPTP